MVRQPHRIGIVSLGLALFLSIGCNGGQYSTTTKPGDGETGRPLEDLAKDVKPPVIVKPNVPSTTGTPANEPSGGVR